MGTKHEFKNLSVKKDGIPQQLIDDKNLKWVAWKLFGKQKIPVHPQTGKKTDANDPKIQLTFEDAVEAQQDGIGIALGSGIGYTIIDFDDCAVDGKWDPEIKAIVDDFDTYTEQSPSGNGVKLWLIGEYDMSQWKNNSGRCEIYTNQNPYMTVTGRGNGKPIVPLDKAKVDALCQKYLEPASAPIEFEPIEDVDQEEAKAVAVEKCLAIEPEISNDGSGYVMKVYKVCVLCGCEFDTAQEVLDEVLEAHGESLDHDAEWFEKRYSQALERNGALFGSQLAEGDDHSDIDFTERVVGRSAGRILYIREWRKFLSWDGKRFADLDDSKLVELIVEVSREMTAKATGKDAKEQRAFYCRYQSRGGIDAVVRLCKSKMSTTCQDLDNNTFLFHCDNVVLDMASGVKVLSHDPMFKNTQCSSVVYDKTAKCPRWMQFCREVFVDQSGKYDPSLCEYVQKLFGYFMTGRTEDQSVYIFHGGGGNGKGVLIKVLERLLGDYGTPVNQEMFVGKAPLDSIADLYGRRCAIASETNEGCALRENQVKNLTGNDKIKARRLFENLWSFEPTHKLVLATNHKPDIYGTDRGIWRRVKLVPFLAKFDNDQEPGLQEKLFSEMPGILNWAIEGYHIMLLEGLSPPAIVLDGTAKYRESMNTIQQWVDDRCQRDPESEVPRSRLYKNYLDYCQEEGHNFPRSNKKFYAELERQGFGSRKSGDRFITGIKIVTEFDV